MNKKEKIKETRRGRGRWRWLKWVWQQKLLTPTMESYKNPLVNELVLLKIYKHLSFPDKKSFRLVCKTWLDCSLDLWRKQSQLGISEDEYLSGVYLGFYKIAEYPLLNLAIKNPKEKARKISVIIGDVPEEVLERYRVENSTKRGSILPLLKQILLQDFPKLKSLTMESAIVSNLSNLHTLKGPFETNQAEFLETFNFNFWSRQVDEEEAQEILSLMPNIKNLQVRGTSCDQFITALNSPLSPSGNYILLESLKINHIWMPGLNPPGSPLLLKAYLDTAHPPLKTLKASIPDYVGEWVGGDALVAHRPILYKNVLFHVEDTLTCLNVRVNIGTGGWFRVLAGCSLPNLTQFFARFRDVTEDSAELLKFDFGMLSRTPRLNVLHLDLEWRSGKPSEKTERIGTELEENELIYQSEGEERRESILLEYLKDFRFELYHKPTESCWRALAATMPNVQKLHAIMDEETFPTVFQLWPEMQHCSLSPHCSALVSSQSICKMQKKVEIGVKIKFGVSCKEKDWDKW